MSATVVLIQPSLSGASDMGWELFAIKVMKIFVMDVRCIYDPIKLFILLLLILRGLISIYDITIACTIIYNNVVIVLLLSF